MRHKLYIFWYSIIEFQPRPGPRHRCQLARTGHGDIRRFQIRAAKTDIGRESVGHRSVRDIAAIGRNHGNAAVDQRGNAHIARAVHRQRIKQLITGQTGKQAPAIRRGKGLVVNFARAGNGKSPDAPGKGFGHVQGFSIRRQTHAVGRPQVRNHFFDVGAVGSGITHAANIGLALADFAVVGKPEAAVLVKHQIIRAEEAAFIAGLVQFFDAPVSYVDIAERFLSIIKYPSFNRY